MSDATAVSGAASRSGWAVWQHDEASHPISSEVFWVRDGVWRPFGIEVDDDGVSVRPPQEWADELRAVLAAE